MPPVGRCRPPDNPQPPASEPPSEPRLKSRWYWDPRCPALLVVLVACAPRLAGHALADEQHDREEIEQLLGRRARAIRTGDMKALFKVYTGSPSEVREHVAGDWSAVFRNHRRLQYDSTVRAVGVRGDRALAREWHRLTAETLQSTSVELGVGGADFALVRLPAGWRLSVLRWETPDLRSDVVGCLAGLNEKDETGVLHLVAELRGGQWRPDRYTWWTGAVGWAPPPKRSPDAVRGELLERLETVAEEQYALGKPGWVHVFVQKNGSFWRAAGGTWYDTEKPEQRWPVSEGDVRALRAEAEHDLGDPAAHVRLSDGLQKMGLFAEAVAELEKAMALDPGAVSAETLAAARARLADDPLVQAHRQVRFENALDVGADHPLGLLSALQQHARSEPTNPEVAAALGIELARIAADQEAAQQLRLARSLSRGQPRSETLSLLMDALTQAVDTTPLKPPAAIRSRLFTLRFTPGEEGVLRLMAALERAQHVIYAEFRMPLGGTEVLLFSDQSAFQKYTRAVRGEAVSEITSAYAIGDQIVTYSQPETDDLSAVAHELGHLAARRLTKGQVLPTWFDEGLACCIQGGYWGYEARVQEARLRGQLLTYAQLEAWDLNNDNSLLAYSEVNHLVEFLSRKQGWAAIQALLGKVGEGLSFEQAFGSITGLSPQDFYGVWLREAFAATGAKGAGQ